MSIQKQVFSETFNIRSSEIRPDGKAKLQTICDLLQEIAGNHALQLNFDVTQLQENSLTWVLHRLDIELERYPEWRERITVETWPAGGNKLRAYRDFLIKDKSGEVILRALSYWLMIDVNKRRPVRIPDEVLDMAPEGIEHVIPVKNDRPGFPDSIETQKTFSVRYSDLDVNRHVNNVRYVEWITETIPRDRLASAFDIEFKAESTFGDEVTAKSSPVLSDTIHSVITDASSKKVLAVANIQLFN